MCIKQALYYHIHLPYKSYNNRVCQKNRLLTTSEEDRFKANFDRKLYPQKHDRDLASKPLASSTSTDERSRSSLCYTVP